VTGPGENPHAGQGAVLLDIGGEIGALVVVMPSGMDGIEVEIRPIHHQHDDGGAHGHTAHVAVVARPSEAGHIHSLVFPALPAGRYELYRRPDGPVQLQVEIRGAAVTEAVWPP